MHLPALATRAAALLLLSVAAAAAQAFDGPVRIAVEPFVTLPADVRHPEGLTSDPRNGDVFVATFDAREPASERRNVLLRYAADGRLLARREFGPTPLTGIAFRDGRIYVLNFGGSMLQRIDADFNADTPIEDVAAFGALQPTAPSPRDVANPDGSRDTLHWGSAGFPAINGMVFDAAGNLYVSDSFQGALLRIERATRCKPCTVDVLSRDPLLATANALPFGANGLAVSDDGRTLFLTNAGDGRLLRMPLPSGPVTVVSESLPGADGLLAHGGLLWVAANQADVVLGVDTGGRIRVRAGEFVGIGDDGAPQGLLFPASTAVSGPWMVVTNLALPLTPAEGDEWEESVRRWNLVRFRLPRP